MSNPQKAKGSAFENKIKKVLTTHYGFKIERVPLSGSLSYLKGDLWAPDNHNEFPYTIELKHHHEVPWNPILISKSALLLKFWDQAISEAKTMKKKPLLIYRWDYSKCDYVCWDDETEVPAQLTYRGYGYFFKMADLTAWLQAQKK